MSTGGGIAISECLQKC